MTAERPPPAPMPAAEIPIDGTILSAIVRRQFPDLAAERIEVVAHGWDNVVARLGDALAVRVPRRRAAVALIEHEWEWLPKLADRLPIETPVPVRLGRPDAVIPWPWTIVRWLDGMPADVAGPPSAADGERLVEAIRALAVPAPATAPSNPYRGVPLAARAERVDEQLRCLGGSDEHRLRSIWADALATPVFDGAPVWVHGDLHPANLLTRDGRLVGILDWGDLTAGDPAADLQVAWTWLGPAERARFLDAMGCDEATVRRARGNALAHGVATVASSADNPRMATIGAATLRQVLLEH